MGRVPILWVVTKVKELGSFEVCLDRTVMSPVSKEIEGEQLAWGH